MDRVVAAESLPTVMSIVVRYADDFVIGFENHSGGNRVFGRTPMHAFAKSGLKLHEGKTRSDRVRSFCD